MISAKTTLTQHLLQEWFAAARRWQPIAAAARQSGIWVWNPPLYTAETYQLFLSRFAPQPGAFLLLGLNPGPHGMAQTGIPFTDCRTAQRRLGIPLTVPGRAPADLQRLLRKSNGRWRATYERSSLGIYRFLDATWGTDLHQAFAQIYFANPCPLLFFSRQGKNLTPADPALKRLPRMQELRCASVMNLHRLLSPRAIVCLGNDASQVLGKLAESLVGPDRVTYYPHPARAVPQNWAQGLRHTLIKKKLLGNLRALD